jgi:hypothetical protein
MELRALVMSLVVQTFSRYGWAYWKFLLRAFLARPQMVPETMTMAVKGHHFFRITRNLLELDRFKSSLSRLAKAFEGRLEGIKGEDYANRLADLKAYRDQALEQMRSRYGKLNQDFRSYADEAVASFKATLDELVARLDRHVERPAAGGTVSLP